MARARISRETYNKLVLAFRSDPGNATAAARSARTGVRTARRAWDKGWPRPSWARPIKDFLGQEKISARAYLERERAEEGARLRDDKSKARLDAAEERARESLAVRASLNTSLMLLGNIGHFSKASNAMCRQAAADLTAAVKERNVEPEEAIAILSKLALISKRATEQLEGSMNALRKHLGEPEKLIGFLSGEPTTRVEGDLAIQRLGEEGLRKAILDLVEGDVDSMEARALIELQIDQATQASEETIN